MSARRDRVAQEQKPSVFADAKATLDTLSRAPTEDGHKYAVIDCTYSPSDGVNRLRNLAVASLVGLAFTGSAAGKGRQQEISRSVEPDKIGCKLGLPVGEDGQLQMASIAERLKVMQDGLSKRLLMGDHVRRQALDSHVPYVLLTYESAEKDKMQADHLLIGSLALAYGHGDGCTVRTQERSPCLQISRELFNLLVSNEISTNTPGFTKA